ncbi:MAG: hypothetical protein J5552_04910 [Prevotella sp.]|nr:hypothetical protein [Prevotella sp.]
MKKIFTLALMMVMTISANAMSYTVAKSEALFLSDKMAYELNLTAAQYDAVYEINLDYLLSVDSRADVYGPWWNRRNADLKYVLTPWQYEKFIAVSYFYRPVSWHAGGWRFDIYGHYTDRGLFFKGRPSVFVHYRGGNNRKSDRFYAGWRNDRPVAHPNNDRGWRDAGHAGATVHHDNRGHGTPNHRTAQNTSRSSGSFGAGRR